MKRFAWLLLVTATGALAWVVQTREEKEVTASLTAARALVATMPSDQKTKLILPFDGPERKTWGFVPGPRVGVSYKMMTPDQRKAGIHLLQESLSESGLQKLEDIRAHEPILREMENGNPGRDEELYWFAIFGTPSEKGAWSWRYEGHHVSLTFTYLDGHIAATTPQFLGSNPADVRTGPKKGDRILAGEEDQGRALVSSLNEAQRKEAVLSKTAPAEIATSNLRKAALQEDKGILFSELTQDQQERLKALIKLYASILKPAAMEKRLAKVEKAGYAKIRFAWLGSLEKGKGHYYRIQGPTFLIEYDNTQNDANHIHTVWRDFDGDFGGDALADHYGHDQHHDHDHRR